MESELDFDSEEDLAEEIFDRPLEEYLLDGIESYLDDLVRRNFNPNPREGINFDAIEQEILENNSFDGIGQLEQKSRKLNLAPGGLSGWNSKSKSKTYALELKGERFWISVSQGFNPEGVKTASYEIMVPGDEPYYRTEDPETLRSGMSAVIGSI